MKKVLLPLAFLGMTMAATSVAVADDVQGDHHKNFQSVWVDNSHQNRMFWYLLWTQKTAEISMTE